MMIMWVILYCFVAYNLALIIEGYEENNLLWTGNFTNHLLVAPLLASGVAILEHWRSKEF